MITKEQLFKSLAHGWPESAYSLPNDYTNFDEDVIWHIEDSAQPSYAEIEAHYNLIAYVDKRVENYPSIVDQLDILYHAGYEGWHDAIRVIKEQFPKP